MSGIGGFLNNLGNSGAGAGLPQGGSGVGGFLDSLLGGFQQAHQAAQDNQMRQAQMGQYQRAAANQQIAQNVAIAKQNPALQQDPKFIAHMKQLSQQAGLPDPSQMTQGPGQQMTGTTGAPLGGASAQGMPKESLNMGVLAPGQEATTIDPKLKDDILNTPAGPQREAKMAGLANIPQEWHTVHAIASDVDKKAMYAQFKDVAAKFGAGKMSGAGAAAAIQPFVEQALAMGMDPNAIAAQYATEAAAGPEVAASIAKMKAAGYKDDAIASFEHQKTVEEPERLAEAIRVAAQNANSKTETAGATVTTAGARVTSAATGQQNANTNLLRAQTGAEAAFINARAHVTQADAAMLSAQTRAGTGTGASGSLVRLKTVASALQADNNNVTRQILAMRAAGGDPTTPDAVGQPSLIDQQLSLQGKLKSVTDQMYQTGVEAQQQPTSNLRMQTGNPTAQIGDAPQATKDDRGRFQITPQGILDTSTGTFTPRNASATADATKHADAANPNAPAAHKAPPVIPPHHSDNAIAPKGMPSTLTADFKGWSPAEQLKFLQKPTVPTDVKAYLKTLLSPQKTAAAAPVAQPPQGGSNGNAPFSQSTYPPGF